MLPEVHCVVCARRNKYSRNGYDVDGGEVPEDGINLRLDSPGAPAIRAAGESSLLFETHPNLESSTVVPDLEHHEDH